MCQQLVSRLVSNGSRYSSDWQVLAVQELQSCTSKHVNKAHLQHLQALKWGKGLNRFVWTHSIYTPGFGG